MSGPWVCFIILSTTKHFGWGCCGNGCFQMRSASRPVLDFAEVRSYDHRCIVSAPWSRQLAGCKRARSSFSASGRLRFCSSLAKHLLRERFSQSLAQKVQFLPRQLCKYQGSTRPEWRILHVVTDCQLKLMQSLERNLCYTSLPRIRM